MYSSYTIKLKNNHNYLHNVKGDSRYGEARRWWSNGGLRDLSYKYRIDGLEGKYRSWWSNGQLSLECHYSKGILIGPYRSWNQDGVLKRRCYYSLDGDGRIVDGYEKQWWSNGDEKNKFK